MLLHVIFTTLLMMSTVRVKAEDDDDDDFDDRESTSPKRYNGKRYCVPYYQCKDGNIITDGAGLLDPRKTNPNTELPLDGKVTPSACLPPYVLCKVPNGTLKEQPYKHQCGIRRANGVDARILSSNQNGDTEFGEFPWQGAILQNVNNQRIFKCACVLINERWALTVAHCLTSLRTSLDHLFALFGVRDTQSHKEPLPPQNAKIANFTIHPEYDSKALRNDIAVVKFREPITYSPSVDSICLPKSNEHHTGQKCIVTGWGKNAWDDGNYSPVLRKVNVAVLNHSTCQKELRKTRLGEFYNLHKSFICAGGDKGQDACKGDGGGPLACYRPSGTYALIGLVSWGIDCGQANVPGVYTNVPEFVRWISEVTRIDLQKFRPQNVEPEF